ncbi:MAG TPA: hypothetical protein VER36_08210 [Flavisolibacter sp.]|nr:hypothetical protein [Flavisolibacter sp.]
MGSKNIEDSQEQREGKAIGQAGRDMQVPDGLKGSHRPKNNPVDLHIPNQEASSATNKQKAEDERSENE